jgi:uncharacterized coiled-coil protein SlyX
MKTRLAVAAMAALVVFGCNNKEPELQKQISQLEGERATLQQNMAEREKFIGEVVQAVNDVYKDVEAARLKEQKLVERAGGPEGAANVTNTDTRKQILDNLSAIGSTLKENQKKIANLQARARKLGGDIAALNNVIEGLKQTIAEREQSIALLEAKVSGLESTVAQKDQVITEKEAVIDQQQKAMNTAYYIAGTRDELKKKGIINKEGGFLWGLLGSTTVLGNDINPADFTPIDWTKEQTIHLNGTIDEIIPARQESFFALANNDERGADLTIKEPKKFWQQKYLVIVLD